ncbi:MAG: hypothetical protein ABIN24_04130 [Dyadobacter sp.]
MENELAGIKTSIQERSKGILILPLIVLICTFSLFFITSYLLIAGLSVIIMFCIFMYCNYFSISKIAKNIHFNAPENKEEIDSVIKLIKKEKVITVNIMPYLILYTALVLCWAGIEESPSRLIEFAIIQFVVFALIYIDQLNKKSRKYSGLLENLETLRFK